MRFILVLLAVCAVCYVLLLGVPDSPGQVQFVKFFYSMKAEVNDLIDHFSLMQNPMVKLTIMAGAAFILSGVVRQIAK